MSTVPVPDQASQLQATRWLSDHGDVLYHFAMRRVRDSHAAEDLVQDTLLAAMTSVDRFTGIAAERTWLIAILKHKLIDHLRKSIRQRPLSDLESDGNFGVFGGNGRWKVRIGRWHGDPQRLAESGEFHKVFDKCLSKLPPQMAQVFWLREGDSMSSKDICKELDISPTNLWTLLHRRRLHLQRCLSVNWFEGTDK